MFEKKDILGHSLKIAALESAHRPNFYKTLLQSDIYILTCDGVDLPHDEITIKKSEKNSIINWKKSDGTSIIPIFSSEKEMCNSLNKPENYLRINAKVFFEISLGAQFVINPFSDYGKELTFLEIKSLLDGTLLQGNVIELEKGTRVLIGQPSNYPYRLVKSLSTYFSQQKEVRKAYLAQIHAHESNDRPHILIAVEGVGDISNVFSELSVLIQASAEPYEYVDLIQLGKAKDLDSYFSEIEPFYS